MKIIIYSLVLFFILKNPIKAMDAFEEKEVPRPLTALYQRAGLNPWLCSLLDAPQKVKAFSKQFSFPESVSEISLDVGCFKEVGVGEIYIGKNGNIIARTRSLENCVGISVWSPCDKVVSLYHAHRDHLKEDASGFKTIFLQPVLKEIANPSQANINIVSSYWSDHLVQAIELIQEAEFKISGISIPEALIEYCVDTYDYTYGYTSDSKCSCFPKIIAEWMEEKVFKRNNEQIEYTKIDQRENEGRECGVNIYINKEKFPDSVLDLTKDIGATMAIDARTGKIGFKHRF